MGVFLPCQNESRSIVPLWQYRISSPKLLLHPGYGRVQASSLGTRCKRTRVSLLYRSELKFQGRDHKNLIYGKRARERLIHAFSRQTYAFADTSVHCHSIESIEIAVSSRGKAGPPHHVYQHRHGSYRFSKPQGPELCQVKPTPSLFSRTE